VQVLDLEGLARHRGSLFGAVGPQPSQKAFETALAYGVAALDPLRPVVIEAESSKIGNCRLPASIWKAMQAAPRLIIESPARARASHLVAAYPDMIADPVRLMGIIDMLRAVHPADQIALWQAQAAAGQFVDMATGLMQAHYDPRYAKHRARQDNAAQVLRAERLDLSGLDALAGQIAAAVAAIIPA